MTQEKADKELGRMVRESLTKVIDKPQECEIDVVIEIPGRGPVLARIRVGHANGYR